MLEATIAPSNIVSLWLGVERSNNEILEKILGITRTKTAAAVDTTMEKLLQKIQMPLIYPMGQPSLPTVQPSDRKSLYAPPLSSAWVHALPSVNLTAHPICFYASSPVQPSHPSDHPSPYAPPIAVGQQPSKLSNLYSNANLYSTGESSIPSGYGQPCVRGLEINQTYRRADFEVSTSLAHTDLPMYFKNLVISLPNVPSNYITNSVAFSVQSLTHDNGKPILVCEYCKKQRHTKDQCWKLHGRPPRGNKRSSNQQQNLRCTDVRETANTSQPIGPTASQTSSPTLSVIAQSGMSQSLGLISVNGTNLWILDSRATDHLIGFSEHFVTYTPCAGNEKNRIVDGSLAPIAGKGQIVLYDGFSLHNVLHVPKLSYNLLSISKITRELHCKATFLPESICFKDFNSGRTIGTARHSRDFTSLMMIPPVVVSLRLVYCLPILAPLNMTLYVSSLSCDVCIGQNNIVFLFPHNHINPHNRLPLFIVTFRVPLRSPPHLGKGGLKPSLMIIPVLPGSTLSPINLSLKRDYSPKLVRLHSSTKWSGRAKKWSPSGSSPFPYAFHFLPSYLWGDAILTAAHLINRMPSRILHLQTPLKCLKESYPSTRLVSKVPLCMFGCTAYVHSFGHNQTKFIPRAQACVFVRYPPHQHGYKCFHSPSRKYFVTMDVTFCEDRPYFPVTHL
ncbi:reverse transcriptase [Cucumis melo var. makuwa]|uniref:Reverse transcriptase n=1 Tax=Cucumis melo var. makuwa TaxID=1194695 RepID=A0A5A7T1J4_CUCMM|nr:reverse transcriptase [Cucumis melo var. makuwa]TYK24118.1 reverse transcriptase [Cucumis melo var. makuwa]